MRMFCLLVVSDPTKWSYVIIGAYTLVVSIFCFILAACKAEDRIVGQKEMKIGTCVTFDKMLLYAEMGVFAE